MGGAVYNLVRLACNTLYPAYASFKAVKSKNVRDYVKWMMYWIVFALFSSMETLLDPFLLFWLPFYTEIKIILLLYLVSPMTRGSGIIYRRFLHPLLCGREQEIDAILERARDQGYQKVSAWAQQSVTWVASCLLATAIKGGGTVLQQIRRSYSMLELSDLAELAFRDQNRFQDITEEEGESYSRPGSTKLKRRAMQHTGQSRTIRKRDSIDRQHPLMMSSHLVCSTESLSSGYCSDSFLPVTTDTMDTEDYELWERRAQTPVTAKRGQRQHSLKGYLSGEDEYESLPFGQPLTSSASRWKAASPDICSSYYPSDRESEDDESPRKDLRPRQLVQQQQAKAGQLTLQQLEAAARHLNLQLVRPAGDDDVIGKEEHRLLDSPMQTKKTTGGEQVGQLHQPGSADMGITEDGHPSYPQPPRRTGKQVLEAAQNPSDPMTDSSGPSDPHVVRSSLLSPPEADTAGSDCSDNEAFFETEEEPSSSPPPPPGPLSRSESARQLLHEAEAKRALVQNYLSSQSRWDQPCGTSVPVTLPNLKPFDPADTTTELAQDGLSTTSTAMAAPDSSQEASAATAPVGHADVPTANPFLVDDTPTESKLNKSVKKAKAPPPPALLSVGSGPTGDQQPTEPSQLLYQSPGYQEDLLLCAPSYPLLSGGRPLSPTLSPELRLRRGLAALSTAAIPNKTSPDETDDELLVREQPLPFPYPLAPSPPPAATKILTISREGITRLRTYPMEKEEEGGAHGAGSSSQLMEEGHSTNSSSSRCPHCTIHSWLPHAPHCTRLKKK